MNEKSIALRLAAELDSVTETGCDPQLADDSASELRRQHAEITRLQDALAAERDARAEWQAMAADESAKTLKRINSRQKNTELADKLRAAIGKRD